MAKWEEYVRKVEPYVPGEQPKVSGIIKLNTNENPYPPTPMVRESLNKTEVDSFRLYPDPCVTDLVKAIADNYKVGEDQVFVGVGSDDVLGMCFMTFFNSDKPILFPEISYSFYSVWADMLRIPYKKLELDENFNIIADSFNVENGGIVFPNPNAPTSIAMDISEVEKIIAANPDSIVIVDEAYVDFGAVSALPLIEKYDNLIVVQTFSKSRSMAGMRIGYAISNPKIIKMLNDVKFSYNSYTMNRTAINYGVASIKDKDYFNDCVSRIIASRERSKEELKKLGFTFPDSKANFIFASHRSMKAAEIFDRLKEEKIYVRYFNQPKIDNYLRITIGTDEEMDRLFEALKRILNS